ncbi:unnamed protein product [Euphydryas editha]|uniref:C2H2-type domain-containing protein n=1 Tax=Euphydryas editha TaxID=104508 RepID=A0AAU9UWX1_EUPED|nr:unnamed protein product [Euphydryas editha]
MSFNHKDNSFKELRRPNYVVCDFCDKEFKNRYDSIIHNASHIIIPLWIQTFYKCDICNNCSTSLEDYENHKSRHHFTENKHTVNGINFTKNRTVQEYKNKQTRKNNVKKEYNVKIKNEADADVVEIESKVETDVVKIEREVVKPLRNRIKFEDDLFSNEIINDLVNNCHVPIPVCDPPWLFSTHNKEKSVKNNDLIDSKYEDNMKREIVDESVSTSVSYSCLMKPGIFSCKYCSNSYPNRFSLIKHEASHIVIVKRCSYTLCLQCDKYIVGGIKNLSKHKAKYHRHGQVPKLRRTHHCKRCGLRFKKYKRHVRNYHVHDCHKCGLEFNNAKQYADHAEQHVDHAEQHVDQGNQHLEHFEQNVAHEDICNKSDVKTNIIRVCDLCFSFLKRKINLKYYLKGDTDDKLGVRYPCDNCGKKYFVLKVVKRIQKVRQKHRDHKNKLTNEDRLKNIQHRFKKLNLLNKFYFFVSFLFL